MKLDQGPDECQIKNYTILYSFTWRNIFVVNSTFFALAVH